MLCRAGEWYLCRYSGTITDSQRAEIAFKKKGFEMDGQLLMARRVVECQPTEQPFSQEAARQQEASQPR